MPPPDSYEFDDTWQNWKPYYGSQSHNFHYASDNDWVAIYFGVAADIRFRTHGLTWGTDTKIEVYSYNGLKGPLVASNDDIGGGWWIPDSKSSRVDIAVPADSAYLVRVINKSAASIYTESHDYPSYMLEIAYN